MYIALISILGVVLKWHYNEYKCFLSLAEFTTDFLLVEIALIYSSCLRENWN